MFYCFNKKETIRKGISRLAMNQKGQSFTELIILVCAGLVVAAFVMIPGMRTFAATVLNALNSWWTSTVSSRIFPTS